MTPREIFRQAYRELRAGGRIGYSRLCAPRMRNAAIEVLRMRQERDDTSAARQRIAYADPVRRRIISGAGSLA